MYFANHRSTITSKSSRRLGLTAISLAAALACGAAMAQGQSTAAPGQDFARGRILVMPNAGMPEAALDKLVKEQGGGKGKRIGQSQLRIIEVPPGLEKQMVDKLARHPHFKFAELDRVVVGDAQSNDPMAGSQWHLPKIGANSAWDISQGSGVTIAILDSGIDTNHPDLVGHIVAGYNFVDGNSNVEDVHSHGTKTAGAAAASLNNGVGVASVAGQVKIMPIRVANSSLYATWSAIASGITYAADRGARIASVSFNGAAGSSAVLNAASYMKSKGGLVFVSAGNSNVDPGYANTSSVVIVAATNSSDTKASFSNFGDHVHLSAPGEAIYTTTWGQSYTSISGTSFSAPITAGVAALVMSANPSLTSTQVENILFSTAVDLGSTGRDIYFGYGRVDAAAAVAAAKSAGGTVVTTDTQPPTASISAPLGAATVSGLTPVNVSVSDNVGVTKAELLLNGAVVASDTNSPFAFSWDSTKVANGMASLSVRAYDAAGNVGQSATVSVNVANSVVATTDTVAPVVTFANPADGSKVSGNVSVSVNGSDNSGVSGLKMTLFINGKQVASSSGSSQIKYGWNTRKIAAGSYTLRVDATDAAGNRSSSSVSVNR
jgi:thermitase